MILGGGAERKKYRCEKETWSVASPRHPNEGEGGGELNCNPSIRPDQESTPKPLGAGEDTPADGEGLALFS